MGLVILYLVLIYMLLSKDVTDASNVFKTYIKFNHLKATLFSIIGFETQTFTIICESICNIISAVTLRM